MDLDILNQIAFSVPALGDPGGWNLHFGRELNASDDRRYFHDPTAGPGLPIVEGKQVTPFAVDVAGAPMRIDRSVAGRLIDPARSFDRTRLAYRDVAAAANRLTLIAALIPAGALTTHTLFCSREPLEEDDRYYLCGMFNSLVANYLVRLRVTTHVTTAIVERLPMPARVRHAQDCSEVVALSAAMCIDGVDADKLARLHAIAARLYGLDRSQFARVLDTFPLVPRGERDRAMAAFCDIVARHVDNAERSAPETNTPDKAYKEVK
jgi:hypothetical protein